MAKFVGLETKPKRRRMENSNPPGEESTSNNETEIKSKNVLNSNETTTSTDESFAFAISCYQELTQCLHQMEVVKGLLKQFETNKDKQILFQVSGIIELLAPQLDKLSQKPGSKTRQNLPLLMKLITEMKMAVKSIKLLGSSVMATKKHVPKAQTPKGTGAPPDKQQQKKKRSSNPIIRDSLLTAVTAHNAHLTGKQENNQQPLLQGYLKKRAEKGVVVKPWSLRWFRQIKDVLYYFQTEQSETHSGSIPLSQILSVDVDHAIPGGFRVRTSARVYRLQALSENELDYWVNGLAFWMEFYKPEPDNIEPLILDNDASSTSFSSPSDRSPSTPSASPATPTGATPHAKPNISQYGFSPVSHSPLNDGLASPHFKLDKEAVKVDVASTPPNASFLNDSNQAQLLTPSGDLQPRTLEEANFIIRQLQEQFVQFHSISLQVEQQQSEIEKLQQEIVTRNALLNNLEKQNLQLKKDILASKKLSGVEKDSLTDRLYEQVRKMETDLREGEDQHTELKKSQKVLLEKNAQNESRIKTLTKNLEQARTEMKAKDKFITKLTLEIKQMKPDTRPSTPTRVKEEMERMREFAEANKTRNVFLSNEIVRIEKEAQMKLAAKENTINRLQAEIEVVTKEFQELRKQNYLIKGADNTYIAELENVKRELFYALGVGIKLHFAISRQSCNADIQSLYEQAQHIPWREWNEWLTARMSENIS